MTSEAEAGVAEPSVDGDGVRPETPVSPAYGQVGTPSVEPTGDERVDEALVRLGQLGARPVAEHVEIFEDVHRRLQDVLGAIDEEAPAGTVPAGTGAVGPPVPRPPGPSVRPFPGRPGGS